MRRAAVSPSVSGPRSEALRFWQIMDHRVHLESRISELWSEIGNVVPVAEPLCPRAKENSNSVATDNARAQPGQSMQTNLLNRDLGLSICLRRAALAAALLLGGRALAAAEKPFDAIVTAASTEVMAGEKPIGELPKGTRLTVTQTTGDWYLIDVPDANPPQQGWIRKSDVQAAVASDPALTRPQQEQLKERVKFEQQMYELRDAGRFDEAIVAAEKMLSIERAILGIDHPDALASLADLAWLHAAQGDFATARKLREEVLAAKIKQLGKDHWQTIDARLAVEKTALLEKLGPAQRGQPQGSGPADRGCVQAVRRRPICQSLGACRASLRNSRHNPWRLDTRTAHRDSRRLQ